VKLVKLVKMVKLTKLVLSHSTTLTFFTSFIYSQRWISNHEFHSSKIFVFFANFAVKW